MGIYNLNAYKVNKYKKYIMCKQLVESATVFCYSYCRIMEIIKI